MRNISLFSVFYIILLGKAAFCQKIFQPNAVPKMVRAKKIRAKINVDGKLNEHDWKTCDVASGFVQVAIQLIAHHLIYWDGLYLQRYKNRDYQFIEIDNDANFTYPKTLRWQAIVQRSP